MCYANYRLNRKKRIDVCMMRHTKTLSSTDRFSSHVSNSINTPSTRMDKHTHTYVHTYQMPPFQQAPHSRTKVAEKERERRTRNEQFHILLPCSIIILFHILVARNDNQYECAFFLLAQNQTVKSQWVKYTYHRWVEKILLNVFLQITVAAANTTITTTIAIEKNNNSNRNALSRREKLSIWNKKQA